MKLKMKKKKFIKDYPDFRIATELEVCEKDRYIVKAYLYKTAADPVAWTTGYAEEKVTDRGVNSTSALENCETSALGRALSAAGYAAKGKRPSREEMSKVVAAKPVKPAVQDVVQDDQDYWTTPVGEYNKVVDAPVTLDKALDLVQDMIGTPQAAPVPSCKHGAMRWREGEKNGRAWGGYQCAHMNAGGVKSDCPPVWYRLGSDGLWKPQEVRA